MPSRVQFMLSCTLVTSIRCRRRREGMERTLEERGFSLLEIMLVVAIGLIVTAIGLPRMNNVIANMKLRSSMTTVSSLLQNTRMLAIKNNKTKTARNFNRTTVPYSLVYY